MRFALTPLVLTPFVPLRKRGCIIIIVIITIRSSISIISKIIIVITIRIIIIIDISSTTINYHYYHHHYHHCGDAGCGWQGPPSGVVTAGAAAPAAGAS